MKDWQMKVEPFAIVDILQIDIHKKINEHAYATIVGLIGEDQDDHYVEMAQQGQWVTISALDPDDGDLVVFKGIISKIAIEVENKFRKLTIETVSASSLMDIIIHKQTFQEKTMTYKEVIDQLQTHYDDCSFYMSLGKDEPINDFLVQYSETDWDFIKRLASHFNSVLVPDYKFGNGIKAYFGLPNRKTETLDLNAYSMKKDLGEFADKVGYQIENLRERDAIYYNFSSRQIYELGAPIVLNGRELIVEQIDTHYQGGECLHQYQLKTAKGLSQPTYLNQILIGASLDATVLAVEKDQVKVHIAIDEAQDPAAARWFPYATIHSSPSGAGWYAMPEKGDQVRLYFPSARENDGYVSSSVHLAGAEERNNPEHKLFKNKYGKEIRLAPGAITLTNNNGMTIQLSDQTGISISSNKSISLQAGGNVSLSANAISINGKEAINLTQNGASLALADDVIFSGAQVKVE